MRWAIIAWPDLSCIDIILSIPCIYEISRYGSSFLKDIVLQNPLMNKWQIITKSICQSR